ncbi:MAG: hypothetical protein H7248_09775 [Microbacteriaceae bacterium]|nr:hypothetical protein [Microbacteriaceae bacterium]
MRTQSETSTARRIFGRPLAAATIVCLAATMAVGIGASSASAAPLTNTASTLSNNQAGATGVTYTQQMTTATTAVIGSVRLAIAPVNAAGLGLGNVYGLGPGTVSYVGGWLTYTLTTPVSIAAGTPVYVEYTGITNGGSSTWGPSFQTLDNATTPVVVDGGGSGTGAIVISGTNTAVTVQVAKSLTFTNDTPAYTLLMDPSLPALSDLSKTVNLTVKTNAGQGYSLTMKNTGLKTAGTGASLYTIPNTATAGVTPAGFLANTFGVSAALTSAGNSIAGLAPAGLATAGNLIGFTSAGATLVNATKPTGNTADTIALTNRVKIDYTTPAGTYADTITYTATPAY